PRPVRPARSGCSAGPSPRAPWRWVRTRPTRTCTPSRWPEIPGKEKGGRLARPPSPCLHGDLVEVRRVRGRVAELDRVGTGVERQGDDNRAGGVEAARRGERDGLPGAAVHAHHRLPPGRRTVAVDERDLVP